MLRKLRRFKLKGLYEKQLVISGSPWNNFSSSSGGKVERILKEVNERDRLCKFIPHIEYLVGSNRKAFGGEGAGACLDIADKTQLILESSHPVRFIVEREIKSLGEENLRLKYQDWVAIFGRSLQNPAFSRYLEAFPEEKGIHHEKLCHIATACECGMFSSDIHQTVVNISSNLHPSKILEFNLGNKYAVLVGDYFAIKTIYFAEKVKSSPVLLDIVRGVEDFAYSSFVSDLMDWGISYPILPNESATLEDWISYGVKASGYFTGGLNAAHTFASAQNLKLSGGEGWGSESEERARLSLFVSRLALTLKAIADMNAFGENGGKSPFLFISLPAILFQLKRPGVFSEFRNHHYKVDQARVFEMQQKIAGSDAMSETKELIGKFSAAAAQSFQDVGQDGFYSQAVIDLLQAVSNFDE